MAVPRGLRDELVKLYPSAKVAQIVAADATLDTALLDVDGPPFVFWQEILHLADASSKLHLLIATAAKHFPERMAPFAAAVSAEPPVAAWNIPEGTGFEKILGQQNTLVDVSYLELGARCARSVVKIVGQREVGTGFLVRPRWVLTNHHVIASEAAATAATFVFNFQKSVAGTDEVAVTARAIAGSHRCDAADDWALVKLDETAAPFGALELAANDPAVNDFVNIIQHAGGGYKQVSIQGNVVVYCADGKVQYLTDTLPGSSGAPVFDRDWHVVALHHAGGWMSRPGSNRTVYCNQGIAVSRLTATVRGLEA